MELLTLLRKQVSDRSPQTITGKGFYRPAVNCIRAPGAVPPTSGWLINNGQHNIKNVTLSLGKP